MKTHNYYVYIITNKRNGTFYTGVTNDLTRRVWEHKEGIYKGFAQRHGLKILVYYEHYTNINEAIRREKRLKKWPREWKLKVIKETNPEWKDLYFDLM